MIKVYTDGASQGDPGPSGAGIWIQADGEILEYSIPLPSMSNHEAEFHAVIEALKICLDKFPDRIISLRSDAKAVVDIINKGHTKNKKFRPLLLQVNTMSASFSLFFIKWIPHTNNKNADMLAKRAIHLQ